MEASSNLTAFGSPLEAKRFLADKIAAEAVHQGSPLSDVERRLLLFSEQELESAADLPADVFENTDVEYEKRITRLLKAAYKRESAGPQGKGKYKQAIQTLRSGDHYLLVMADAAFAEMHPVRDLFIYIAIGLLVLAAIIALAEWR